MSGPPRVTRRRIVAGILAAGWGAALGVYATADAVQDDPDVYDLEHSKPYVRQLEVIGGKAAVMGSEITQWFGGLWHGKRLALPIAGLTAAVALAFDAWDRGRRAPSGRPAAPRDGDGR